MILNNEEMMEVNGGGLSVGLAIVIGGTISFLIGLVDGIVHPKKCN